MFTQQVHTEYYNQKWKEDNKEFCVFQSALTTFCNHRSLIRDPITPNNAIVALFHPKYARRISLF